jgi:hypothetical protein
MPKVSTDKIFQAALEHDGNLRATADALGLASRSVAWSRLKSAGLLEELRARTGTTKSASPKEKIEVRPRGNYTDVDYLGTKIETEEELLQHAGIDMELYEIDRVVVNNWEVAGKKAKNDWQGVWKTGLRQIKITLKRKKEDHLSVERILAKIEAASPLILPIKYPKAKKSKPKRALEISIMDPHYGMLCYQGESDHSWDLEQCEKMCMWSIDNLVERAKGYGPFEEIVFPFGNDFLHHDNLQHTTTKGTLQPEGLPFLYVYERAIELAITMVERLAELAPVKVIQVSGNHDQVAAFTMGHVLKAYYRNDPNVDVDVSPSPYKFWNFGTNLIGFDHGHHVKPARLAALMAHECVNLWATTTFREWHLGDQHRKGSGSPVTMEEQGVGVEYLPALTPPNAWHRLKAFNWQQRGAMGFVWDHAEGPLARVQVNLNSYTGRPTGK